MTICFSSYKNEVKSTFKSVVIGDFTSFPINSQQEHINRSIRALVPDYYDDSQLLALIGNAVISINHNRSSTVVAGSIDEIGYINGM